MTETVTLYKCDKCKKVITDFNGGLVVQGNIYNADPTNPGGIIGNNFSFSADDSDPHFEMSSVEKSVYCIPCFMNTVLPDKKLSLTRGLPDYD